MYQQQIEKAVNSYRQQIIDATSRLVRIPSLKGEPKEGMPFGELPGKALEEALAIGTELGFATTNYDGYVGAIDLSDKPAGLDILAHLDIVPAPPEEWTVCQPFEPVEKDGKLYGRGTADDKGPAISALFAMQVVRDLKIPLTKNVRLLLGTDEESGSQDIVYYYKNNPPAPATFSPDSSYPVVNVEKGRLNAALVAKFPLPTGAHVVNLDCGLRPNVVPDQATATISGLTAAEVESAAPAWAAATKQQLVIEEQGSQLILYVKGVGGHAAYPETTNNALTGMVDLLARLPFGDSPQQKAIQNLAALFPHQDWKGSAAGIAMEDEVSSYLTVCLNILKVDTTGLRGEIDSRRPICSTEENTTKVLEQNAAKKGLDVEVISIDLPHHVPEDSHFIQMLLKAYEQYSGLEGYCTLTGGGTYVHGLENAVAFGASLPGTETNIHGANECAVIDEMLLSAKIFAQVIIDMCQYTSTIGYPRAPTPFFT